MISIDRCIISCMISVDRCYHKLLIIDDQYWSVHHVMTPRLEHPGNNKNWQWAFVGTARDNKNLEDAKSMMLWKFQSLQQWPGLNGEINHPTIDILLEGVKSNQFQNLSLSKSPPTAGWLLLEALQKQADLADFRWKHSQSRMTFVESSMVAIHKTRKSRQY